MGPLRLLFTSVLAAAFIGCDKATNPIQEKLADDNVTIILPVKPTLSESFAAKELKYHLEKATDKTIAVISEGEKPVKGRRFYIGNVKSLAAAGIDYASLQVEERNVKGIKDDLFLVGGELPGFDDIVKTDKFRNAYGLAGGGTLDAV